MIGGILAPQESIIEVSASCESDAELGRVINTEHCDFVRWRGCSTVRQQNQWQAKGKPKEDSMASVGQ